VFPLLAPGIRYNQPTMRIGYFGGSFDPPHLGHLRVASAAAEAFSLDRVLLAPTGVQPLKPEGLIASFPDRLAMVSLLCASAPLLEPSSIDAPHHDLLPNYTVDTLLHLRAQLSPSDDLFVLVGADAFLDLPRWRSPDQLLTLANWIVLSRPGFSLRHLDALALTPSQLARVHLLETLADPTSATHIRSLLSQNLPCGDLLPASVLEYIRAHHLYES
jgi:nicotinate-nucleotide adenylyltransferase